MRNDDLKNLTLTGLLSESGLSSESVMSLCEWIDGQGQGKMIKNEKLLRATGYRKLWRAMIAVFLKGERT